MTDYWKAPVLSSGGLKRRRKTQHILFLTQLILFVIIMFLPSCRAVPVPSPPPEEAKQVFNKHGNPIVQSDPATYFGGDDYDAYLNWYYYAKEQYQHSYFMAAPDYSSSSSKAGIALHWKIDDTNNKLYMAIAAKTQAWLGFGFSENGGMRGADVVTFNGTDLVDGYILETLQAPQRDDCQSWELHESHVDDGFMIIQASRMLDTHDSQDFVIRNDGNGGPPTRIIAAWGGDDQQGGRGVMYHGPNHRVKTSIYLFSGKTVADQKQAFREEMEQEAEGSFVIHADQFPVPTTETNYVKFCFSYDYMLQNGMPADGGIAKHIVGMEAVIDNSKYVHHMSIAGNTMDKWSMDGNCTQFPPMEAVYLWAPGTEPYSLPKEAGFALDEANHGYLSFQVEIHYNNPWHDKGQLDNTGIRLYYTTQTRPNDMGVLTTGDPLIALKGTPIGNGLTRHTFICPSTCSNAILGDQEITITKSYLHMHKKGTAMQNEIVRDGQVIHTSKVDYFDFDQQGQFSVIEDSYTMKAGDSVRTTCFYNSNDDTTFGKSSQEEMCIFNGYYYPRQYFMTAIPFVCIIGVYYGCDSNYTEATVLEHPQDVGRTFGSTPTEDSTTCPVVMNHVAPVQSSAASSAIHQSIVCWVTVMSMMYYYFAATPLL